MLLLLAFLGAGSFSASVVTAAKKGRGKAPAQTDDCKTDKDCVLVTDECCSCAEGGKQRAIPKKQKDTYENDRKKRCKDTACTEMVSTDPSCSQQHVFCGAGICELGDAPPDATP